MRSPALGRTIRRIVLTGLVCAGLAAAIGIALERARFGASEEEALARVEAGVRSEINAVAETLTEIAESVGREPALFDAAAIDIAGRRALLDRADLALEGRTRGVFAVTAYRPSGAWPLAWSGVPSEIPVERISQDEAFFVAPGPLGLRLVYIKPILDPASAHRVGVVAAERVLSAARGIRPASPESVLAIDTPVPVSVREHNSAQPGDTGMFVVTDPHGQPLLDARIPAESVRTARLVWRQDVAAAVLTILALTILICVPPLLRFRPSPGFFGKQMRIAGAVAVVLISARLLLWFAPVERWVDQIFRTNALGATLRLILRSPIDFMLTMAVFAALLAIAYAVLEGLRRKVRRRIAPPADSNDWVMFSVTQLVAGTVVALLFVGYEIVLGNAISATSVDALHFSLHPLVSARLAFAVGLILAQAVAFWAAILTVQLATVQWRLPRSGSTAAAAFVLRLIPVIAVAVVPRVVGAAPSTVPMLPTALAGVACMSLAWAMGWARPWYRHASQAVRLFAGALVLLVPAFVLYPSVLHFADRGLKRLIEEEYAQQALQQRDLIQRKLSDVLQQIDRTRLPNLGQLPRQQGVSAAAALQLWSQTDLATERLASSVELYAPDGSLASRFALNLPDYVSATQRWTEPSCQWEIFEEASLFGSEERRLLHAGRGICAPGSDVPTGGSIVVNAMLDYDALPFITIRNPYNELVRSPDSIPREGSAGRTVQFVVYGWGRGSLYASGARAWPLDESLLSVIAQSRRPFWTTMTDGQQRFSTYMLNDRVGIYVLGYPVITRLDHLINLAELTTLVGLLYVLILGLAWLISVLAGTTAASGRHLLHEVRASFYRKLFLAFLAAAVLPVMVLAFAARNFFADQLRAGVESDARRIASVAQRVIEEYVALQQRDTGSGPDDDIMVWLSRALQQDVNIYEGPQLLATSERDLFTSGLLPERTPSEVYRAIALDRLGSHVTEEVVGEVRHVLASVPVRVWSGGAILTVPLALRQQEVDQEIDTLDRRVLLAALLFALAGAGMGYYMAERIGDPVNRLTRATRRIARGDFSARVIETSSDELTRLVEDFNRMAAELQRQRNQLERTHRLEAWAEMARQVAHDIKNPLTPIQLSSEHLMRVHKDRGEPLSPVLEECVGAIMSQVKLLRQISAEFSSFASRPTAHPVPTALSDLVANVFEPYMTGLAGRISISLDISPALPQVLVDRTLLARALTNIIENALHAMPGTGALKVKAEDSPSMVLLSVADTGTGMDAEALARIFEPYFSTKATGTGLGLTIAKRNVELNGGHIHVHSGQGEGTTVVLEVPKA